MKVLRDYSGEFVPEVQFSDFSRDTLTELLTLYCRLYSRLDNFWYISLKGRLSDKDVLTCLMDTWEKNCHYEMSNITKLLNIRGNDVATFMKALQMTPWFRNNQIRIEIRNKNDAILTVFHCTALEAFEKEAKEGEKTVCQIAEPKALKDYASFFNPKIEVKFLKLPPRSSQEDVCCQWQFVLPSKS